MQTPNVPAKLQQAAEEAGLKDHLTNVEYFLGTENFAVVRYRGMQRLMAEFFAFLSRNARNPTDYFRLPAERVIHIGSQIDLLGNRDSS
jgi:KUP system potassium uptake protein